MTAKPLRGTGRARIDFGRIGLGCLSLGNYPAAISHQEAARIVETAWQSGVRTFDTAPLYGRGLSERRLGLALPADQRDAAVICTKVGRRLLACPERRFSPDKAAQIFIDPAPFDTVFDYTHDGALRSIEDSLQRLGTGRLDVVHIHNIDPALHEADALEQMFSQCMSGAYRALDKLRAEGVIKAIGVGNNSLSMLERFIAAGDFDCLMMAGHYTLLDRSAEESLLGKCARKGIQVLLGAPFESGVLATGSHQANLGYKALDQQQMAQLRSIEACCERWGVPLAAAALQFPLRHEAIACVVPGAATASQAAANVAALSCPIAESFWAELKEIEPVSPTAAMAAH